MFVPAQVIEESLCDRVGFFVGRRASQRLLPVLDFPVCSADFGRPGCAFVSCLDVALSIDAGFGEVCVDGFPGLLELVGEAMQCCQFVGLVGATEDAMVLEHHVEFGDVGVDVFRVAAIYSAEGSMHQGWWFSAEESIHVKIEKAWSMVCFEEDIKWHHAALGGIREEV